MVPKTKRTALFAGEFSEDEAARRRDEVVRRMANTPPQPRTKSPGRPRGKKKPSGPGRAGRKPSAGKGA